MPDAHWFKLLQVAGLFRGSARGFPGRESGTGPGVLKPAATLSEAEADLFGVRLNSG
jgi:hypothetical protein